MATTVVSERVIQCKSCGYTDKEDAFAYGEGRSFGRHPDHRFCRQCGRSITYFGYWVVATLREVA